jgi:NAD(P)H-hydrate epimerase
VDADGLNNLADGKFDLSDHAGPRILTPHEGEFSRLVGQAAGGRGELEESAVRLAREQQIVVLLKGPKTMVTDGERRYHNRSGNAGMATAGSGDVLSGIIAALVGQQMDVFEAAEVGSHLHGLAGDQFAERSDSASMLATDLIDELPVAMSEMRSGGQN